MPVSCFQSREIAIAPTYTRTYPASPRFRHFKSCKSFRGLPGSKSGRKKRGVGSRKLNFRRSKPKVVRDKKSIRWNWNGLEKARQTNRSFGTASVSWFQARDIVDIGYKLTRGRWSWFETNNRVPLLPVFRAGNYSSRRKLKFSKCMSLDLNLDEGFAK